MKDFRSRVCGSASRLLATLIWRASRAHDAQDFDIAGEYNAAMVPDAECVKIVTGAHRRSTDALTVLVHGCQQHATNLPPTIRAQIARLQAAIPTAMGYVCSVGTVIGVAAVDVAGVERIPAVAAESVVSRTAPVF